METLQELRNQLDIVDDQIVRLFEERMSICEKVGDYKIGAGKKVFDRVREEAKLIDVASKVSTDFNKKGVQELYQQLMSMSRKLQYQKLVKAGVLEKLPFVGISSLEGEKARIVFPGTEGSYSQEVTRKYFGDNCNSFYVATFRDAMEAIEEGAADYAVLPIENSTAGEVDEMYNLLVEFENYIVGEVVIPVQHTYGPEGLEDQINDESGNSTRFIVVTNQKVFLEDAKKISICFELPHESGSLYQILSHFIYNNLNMTKIKSRLVEGKSLEYRFFIDFDGNLADASVKNAISGLREEARNLRILGNY